MGTERKKKESRLKKVQGQENLGVEGREMRGRGRETGRGRGRALLKEVSSSPIGLVVTGR